MMLVVVAAAKGTLSEETVQLFLRQIGNYSQPSVSVTVDVADYISLLTKARTI